LSAFGRSGPPATASWAPVWIGALIGAVACAAFFGRGGFLLGAMLGALVGAGLRAPRRAMLEARWEELESRVASLENEIADLKAAGSPQPTPPAAAAAPPRVTAQAPAPAAAPVRKPPPALQPVFTLAATPLRAAALEPPPADAGAAGRAAPVLPDLRAWLLGGNTVARVGLLILFVGIAFLLRYVAEHTRVPIEVRLLGVSLGALVFLVLGWRLRERRAGFAMTLQGGAIGILYLTAFASLRLYGVLAPGAAFAFMAMLAILSGVLAVLQDARALATLGALGGFIAPLLISTGAGRIELLLGFYLLLDLGVLGVAWFRAWRELNWIAFVFTFTVSGLWSVQRYTPADFAVGQGYLAVFWVLFLSVGVLHALRQSGASRGRFDTALVFALPLVAFGIQTRFTQGLSLAYAALLGSAVYLAISAALLRRRETALRLLVEANFGLGVAFLTLAVPLAASAQWTAAAWTLEGVATAWIGLRQRRALPLLAGLLLQVLGPLALAHAVLEGKASLAPQWSGVTINLAVFAAGAMVLAFLLAPRSEDPWPAPAGLPRTWLAWLMRLAGWAWVGVLLWQPLEHPAYIYAWAALGLLLAVAERRATTGAPPIGLSAEWVASVAWVVASVAAAVAATPADPRHSIGATIVPRLVTAAAALAEALLSVGRGGLRRTAAGVLLSLSVFGWLFAVLAEAVARDEPALAVAQLALILAGFAAMGLGWLAARLRWSWPQRLAWAFHAALLVFAGYEVWCAAWEGRPPSELNGALAWIFGWGVYYARFAQADRSSAELPPQTVAALHVAGLWMLPAMLAAESAIRLGQVAGDGWVHASWAALAAAALWFATLQPPRWPASAAPRAYAEVGTAGLVGFALCWLLASGLRHAGDPAPLPALPLLNPMDLASLLLVAALAQWRRLVRARAIADAVLAGSAFLVANLVLLRALHFTAHVGWSIAQWSGSLLVQASLSILWTLIAMVAMLVAHRVALRSLWLAGAGLLGIVVVKLLLVDLAGRGTVERIVSFVAVGLLIMLIGYLTPVPPARALPAGGAIDPEAGA